MRKFIVLIIVFFFSLELPAKTPTLEEVCAKAEMDAEMDINATMWFFGGFLLGLTGVGAAYVIEPSPPALRLIGQPPDYVAIYTDCYKQKGKSIQTSAALRGCIAGALVKAGCTAFYYLLILLPASASYNY